MTMRLAHRSMITLCNNAKVAVTSCQNTHPSRLHCELHFMRHTVQHVT
jgi:hypothetical protein